MESAEISKSLDVHLPETRSRRWTHLGQLPPVERVSRIKLKDKGIVDLGCRPDATRESEEEKEEER